MEDDISDTDLNSMPHRRLKFIDGYLSSYCSIINSPKRLEQIRQAKQLVYVLCYLKSDRMREKG